MGGAVANVVVLCSLLMVHVCVGQEHTPNLPVLFSFSQPSHNVAVFRGADLTRAIASGAVKGFGNLGHGGGVGHVLGHGQGHVVHPVSHPVVPSVRVVSQPPPVVTTVVPHPPVPVVAAPLPVAPVLHRPTVSAAYVDPYYSEDAQYAYEYSVLDEGFGTNFGAKETRSGPLTEGQYYVALPDGRLETVTYTVEGNSD